MNSNNTIENIGVFGIVVGIIGVVFGAWQAKKTGDVAKKLNLSLEELSKKTPVDISDDIVNKAVEIAVDREVHKSVVSTVNEVKAEKINAIKTEVGKEVKRSLETIREDVGREISDQVADIDRDALRETVKKQAEKTMISKLNGTLDESVKKFNEKADEKLNEIVEDCREKIEEAEKNYKNNLQTVTKLYDGVIDIITPWKNKLNGGNGFNVRFGE